MGKNVGSSSKAPATWNNHNISIFCDLCIKEGQLKNKWDALKIEWKLWKELVGKETGLGWNSSKGTIDASDEWWNNKIQINDEYAKLRKKGINPEMEEKLDRMFMNTTATGEHAWAPSCGILPPETEEASMGDVIPLEGSDDSDETIQAIKNATKKGKRRAPEQLNKKSKIRKEEKLEVLKN
ncbi:unnamed protein product [Prunus armeniaca]